MIRIKSLEDYTNYFGVCCRFWKSKEKYHLQTLLDNEILERLQFKKYEDNNLKDKMYKLVSYEEIDNAYSVSFFLRNHQIGSQNIPHWYLDVW